MHNILIVEDNYTQLESLKHTICNHYPNWNVKTASNYTDAKDLLNESITTGNSFSLFLFDIQLTQEPGDRGGFFLAKEVRKQPVYYKTPILFLTAVSDEGNFALSEFHCYNYITKPYTSSDILRQLEQMLITGYLEDTLEITDTNRIKHRIHCDEIYTIESKSHTLIMTTTHGSFTTREYTLENILKILNKNFIQCHRRFIINTTHIYTYDKASQYIKIGNYSVPIGRNYLKKFDSFFTKEN